ncbi:formylglycine-generating enzyme family protein [Cohnella silvisoli]|uniref:Formylglycine-generating enzyme family protein n=1 Tax=Cohnella silvisoli TaxID=2873699 RepID=A0ABV1KQW5_9BACL|nr:formylglycine-generating enzyme family protein [Cohnella silvisoli]MCD9024552.1 formylglycine-generating enzyme family protein [Cohnella silvisoli]
MQSENRSCSCAASRIHTDTSIEHKATYPLSQSGRENKSDSVIDARQGMVLLPGGSFLMGTSDGEGFPADGEGPVREVVLRPFYIDPYAVSNEKFNQFVNESGYVTEAERYGWSFVFHLFVSPETARRVTQSPVQTPWWLVVEGANWRQPFGPDSNLDGRMDHPVIHVSWNDAQAYCEWAGRRLPTESEWEFAARGGLVQKRYPWGDELKPGGVHRCNIWQGKFPIKDNGSDGYKDTAPVHAYEPNGYGLYNVSGNVWEWCQNGFTVDHSAVDPNEDTRVIRGGSYLCHRSYCNRYRVAARSKNTPDSSTGNIGFRCAADA